MSRFHLLSALALALFLPAITAAQDRDTQEIQKYVLTDAGLAKYSQATRKLAMLPADESGACDDAGDSLSIDETAAKLNSLPAAKSAIQEAGLTAREYVVFSFALLQTGLAVWGGDQAGGKPSSVSPANVAFYKKNEPNLKKLEALAAHPDCDDGEDDGEDGE
jgi:hypothetical protein